jgi:hypothetical protein
LNYKFIVCPPGGQLVLQDIDITSKTETNSMRRLNTLAHYGVKDKVMVSLVPKQIDSPSHHIYQVRIRTGFFPFLTPKEFFLCTQVWYRTILRKVWSVKILDMGN